jgi:hypothetical protein
MLLEKAGKVLRILVSRLLLLMPKSCYSKTENRQYKRERSKNIRKWKKIMLERMTTILQTATFKGIIFFIVRLKMCK